MTAFYKTEKTDYEIGVLILSQKQGNWSKLASFTGIGSELDYVGLVEELLDFSKFQSGEMKLSLERMDLREVLDDLLLQFAIRSQDKEVALHMDIPSFPLAVMGDFNRLKQVFVNLLDNSFKFTHRGGCITVTAAKSGGRLTISVADTGEGIDATDLPHITGKFYKGRSKLSGSGLGLAICKEIVELHGGRLLIHSLPGQGTTITVDLPAAEAMDSKAKG